MQRAGPVCFYEVLAPYYHQVRSTILIAASSAGRGNNSTENTAAAVEHAACQGSPSGATQEGSIMAAWAHRLSLQLVRDSSHSQLSARPTHPAALLCSCRRDGIVAETARWGCHSHWPTAALIPHLIKQHHAGQRQHFTPHLSRQQHGSWGGGEGAGLHGTTLRQCRTDETMCHALVSKWMQHA